MAYKLSEGVVDDVLGVLSANLGAYLDLIDTEKDDGTELADIVAWHRSEMDVLAIPAYPVGIVVVPHAAVVEEHGSSLTVVYDLQVGVIHHDSNIDRLKQHLQRYQRAVLEVIKAAETAGAIPDMVLLQELSEDPIFAPPDSEYISDIGVTAQVRRKETA